MCVGGEGPGEVNLGKEIEGKRAEEGKMKGVI